MARLRHAVLADLPAVVDVWVDAFAGDPFLRWMSGGSSWSDFGPPWMAFIADRCFQRGHTFVDEVRDVAIAWIPPDLSMVSPDDMVRGRGIIAEHAGEERADEALATIVQARAALTEGTHWTLQYVGVRSPGRGLGAEAVAPGLARVDDDGLSCALVSTNPANVSFYRRLGFEITVEIPTPDGAATIRPMLRSAT